MRKEFETRTEFSREEVEAWFDHAKSEEVEKRFANRYWYGH